MNLPPSWFIEIAHQSLDSTTLKVECTRFLYNELLFTLNSLLIEMRMYARTCKRKQTIVGDFNLALNARNIEPRIHHRLHPSSDEELNLSTMCLMEEPYSQTKIKLIQISIHWLAINGRQPIIPENPSLQNSIDKPVNKVNMKSNPLKFDLTTEHLSPKASVIQKLYEIGRLTEHSPSNKTWSANADQYFIPTNECSNVLQNDSKSNSIIAHELSIEQQLYYKTLTEACFSTNKRVCLEALSSLTTDAAITPLVPR
ncbi:unnamed protein product, partial [Didymodactylos carnosus]